MDAYGSFLPPAPLLRSGEDSGKPSEVQTLRMDGCNLRHNVLEVLGMSPLCRDATDPEILCSKTRCTRGYQGY